MKNRITSWYFKIFNLKPEEAPKFSYLFWHSFALWFFISFYFVASNGVFVHNFGSDFLPLAYMGAGVMGYLVTLLYSKIQKFVTTKYLFIGAVVFMVIFPILIRVTHGILPSENERWLSFFVFIWAWPFIALVNTESGGMALQFLNLRQVKRQFGMIGIGGIISSILSYFIIPVIMPFLSHPFDLLYVGSFGAIAAVYLVWKMFKVFPEDSVKLISTQRAESSKSILGWMKDRYFLLMFVSAMLSMVAIYFTDFGYLSSIKVQTSLIKTAEDAANFISLMAGIVKTGEFLLSYFSDRILSKHGLRLGLLALPLSLGMLVTLAAAMGIMFGAESIFFFLVIVITKAAERVVRRGLEDPSFNVLYQPLQGKQKLEIQTKVGVLQQLSIGIGGVLLFAISHLLQSDGKFMLRYYPLFYLPLLIGWAFVARNLFLSYKGTLRQLLNDMSKAQKKDTGKFKYGDELITRKLKQLNEKVVRFGTILLAQTNSRALDPHISGLFEKNDFITNKSVLHTVDPFSSRKIATELKHMKVDDMTPEMKVLVKNAQHYLDTKAVLDFSGKTTEEVIASQDQMLKLDYLKWLSKNKPDNLEQIVIRILDDTDDKVVKAAVKYSADLNSEVVNIKLVELLRKPWIMQIVSSVLVECTKGILPELEKYFTTEHHDLALLKKIIEIYSKIGTQAAKTCLLNHIDFEDRDIQFAVIDGLSYCRYQATEEERPVIVRKIDEIVGRLLWLQMSLIEVESEKNTLKLVQSLELETDQNNELLFSLLGFLHKPTTITIIRRNIIGENTIFALELIDNFIDPDIKQRINPLFDNISLAQRLRKLGHLRTIKKLGFTNRLIDIISTDYIDIDNWTRAKAIELLGKTHKQKKSTQTKVTKATDFKDIQVWTHEQVNQILEVIRKSEMPDEIFVCMHHADELVFSTAAKIIYEENPSRCFDYLQRLTTEKQAYFDLLENGESDDKTLITERVRWLKRNPLFFSVPEYSLVKLAKIFRTKNLKKGDKVTIRFHENPEEDIFIINKGKLAYFHEDGTNTEFGKDSFIARGVNLPENARELTAVANTQLLIGNRFRYFNMLVDEVDMANQMFDMITSEAEFKQ